MITKKECLKALKFEELENGELYFDKNNVPCRYYSILGKFKYKDGSLKDFEDNYFYREQVEECQN